MKNNVFVLFFILNLVSAINLFSLELWNGLFTEMSMDEVTVKVRQTLNIEQQIIQRNEINKYGEIANDLVKEIFPDKIPVLEIYSPIATYKQDYNRYRNKYEANINCYFYHGKLFAINILFDISSDDLINMLVNQYGNYQRTVKTFPSPLGGYDVTYYSWRTNDRLLFLSGISLWYIDKNTSDNYIKMLEEEKLKKERESRESEERRRNEANQNLKL